MERLSFVTRRHTKYLDIEFNRAPSFRVNYALRDLGFVYLAHITSYRGTRHFDEAIDIANKAVENEKKAHSLDGYGANICFDCANAGRGRLSPCAWEREFKPVEGWNAEEVVRQSTYGDNNKVVTSYHIIDCPMFIQEPPRTARRK